MADNGPRTLFLVRFQGSAPLRDPKEREIPLLAGPLGSGMEVFRDDIVCTNLQRGTLETYRELKRVGCPRVRLIIPQAVTGQQSRLAIQIPHSEFRFQDTGDRLGD